MDMRGYRPPKTVKVEIANPCVTCGDFPSHEVRYGFGEFEGTEIHRIWCRGFDKKTNSSHDILLMADTFEEALVAWNKHNKKEDRGENTCEGGFDF